MKSHGFLCSCAASSTFSFSVIFRCFSGFVAAVPNVDIHSVHLSCSGRNSDGVGVQIVLSLSLSFSSWGWGGGGGGGEFLACRL